MQVVGADAVHKEAGVLADVLRRSREETSVSAWEIRWPALENWGPGSSLSKPSSPRAALKNPSPPLALFLCQRLGDEQMLWKEVRGLEQGHHLPPAPFGLP